MLRMPRVVKFAATKRSDSASEHRALPGADCPCEVALKWV